MRIALVTGSYPPEACGVGDYTAKLYEALKNESNDLQVELIYGGSWSLWDTSEKLREIRERSVDILHIQYPTMGYRGGFAPRILPCLFSPSIVTFHEFDNFSYKGRIGTMPLGLCADRVIFSSSFEREAFLHCYPWKRENSKVIPIGSNIPAVKNDRKDFNHIIFFGLIMPGKGLEDFLSLVAISENKRCGFYFSIVGKVPEKFERYYKDLREGASGLPIAWVQNLTPEETARTISQAAFCYLPYPDGVSERRGSLLALLKNGVFVVTKRGKQTLDLFPSMLEIGDDPEVALNLFIKYRYSPHLTDPFVKNGFVYAGTRTWEFIAQEHRSLYSSTVR